MKTMMALSERRSDIEEIRVRLKASCLKKDTTSCFLLVKKVIEFMTRGIDVSLLFFEMLEASATHDIIQKKLVYLYICTYAESNSKSALLTVNTLVNDVLVDGNPVIKGLALRSMFNIRLPSLVQYMTQALIKSLDDGSCYVRQNAVMASLKLYKIDPSLFYDLKLLSKLYQMIDDVDSQVSFNAICCIDEVLKDTGGIDFDQKLVTSIICERLSDYHEWHQCILLEKVKRYQPSCDEEIYEYLNSLDEKLKHTNKGLVMASINLFLQFTKSLDVLKSDVFSTIKGPILSMLKSSATELQTVFLHHILVLLRMQPNCYSKEYRCFFIKFNEPANVKYKKLEILLEVVTEGNLQRIINEIQEYIFKSDIELAYLAIKLLGNIAIRYSFALNGCLTQLLDVLKCRVEYLAAYVLECLRELMARHSSIVSSVLPDLEDCWDFVENYANGKASLLWIYGEFGEAISTAPYKLEELVDDIADEQSHVVKMALLTALMKLFLKRPPECERSVKKYLRYCIDEEKNMAVHDKALFYLRLLQNAQEAEKVILSNDMLIPPQVPYVRKNIGDDDFRFKEFNTLSILYNQPSSSFCKINAYDKIKIDLSHKKVAGFAAAKKEVVVATILNLSEEENDDVACSPEEPLRKQFTFDSAFVMQMDEFHRMWNDSNIFSSIFQTTVTRTPTHDFTIEVLKKHFKLLASSPAQHVKKRFLLYTKMITDNAIAIMEMVFDNNEIYVTAKCKNELLLDEFVKYWKDVALKDFI